MFNLSTKDLETQLTRLCFGKEWITERVYLRRIRDRQVFVNSNILAILKKCNIENPLLKQQIKSVSGSFGNYQHEGLTYFWPLKNGRSVMPNSRLFSRLKMFDLSPDADVSSLYRLATGEHNRLAEFCQALEFYRAGINNFVVPADQQNLAGIEKTFLTWFPPKPKCVTPRIEPVDAAVQANILWFLFEFRLNEIQGTEETIKFLQEIVKSGLILADAFRISHYYPDPAIIIYLLSRAIVWGKIDRMWQLRSEILAQAAEIRPRTQLQKQCLVSVYLLWNEKAKAREMLETGSSDLNKTGTFYVAPFLAPLMIRSSRFKRLAAHQFFQVKFESSALNLALMLWMRQQLDG